jgi:hypothetical protein
LHNFVVSNFQPSLYSISSHVGQREEGGADDNLMHAKDPGDD